MTMHAARLARSERLRRVIAVLQDGEEHSTLDIIQRANVCAVNIIISELRAPPNNANIPCRCIGRGRFVYRLITGEQAA